LAAAMALFVSQPGTEEFDRLAIELGHDHDRDGMDDITGEDLYGADSRFEEPDPSEWMPEMPSRRRRYSEEEPYKPERWGSKPDVLRKIWLTFEEPGYSPAALVVNLGVTFLILVAITAFTVETSPEYYGREVAPFPQIEVFCTTVFTLEVVLRAISCPDICAFIKNWWNIADLLAILPYYLEIIAKATGNPGGQGAQYAVVRVVRLVRLLKLVRYGQRNKKMGGMLKVFRETMQESESNLKMMIMFEVLTMVICGAVTYYIERGTFHKDGAACSALLPPGHGFLLVDAEDTCLQGPEGAGLCQYVAGAPAGEECISATAKFCSGVDRLGADCASDQNLLDKTWYFKKNVRKTVGWARNDGTGDCVAPDGSMKCDSGDNDEVACLMRGLTDNDGTACVWAAQNTVAAAMDRVGEEEVTKQAMFPTIFTGMYWTLVTVTGVGYGDMVPTSVAGKFATFITILMGLLLIALPVSVIGGNFQACYMRLIDSEAKQQSSTTASAAAFQMSGLRHRLRAHRDGVEALRRENPIEEPEQAPDQKLPHAHARRGSLDRAKMQLQDMGPKVAESPSKKALNAKKISLNGVRTTRDFARCVYHTTAKNSAQCAVRTCTIIPAAADAKPLSGIIPNGRH
jgi:hypothetical protein